MYAMHIESFLSVDGYSVADDTLIGNDLMCFTAVLQMRFYLWPVGKTVGQIHRTTGSVIL